MPSHSRQWQKESYTDYKKLDRPLYYYCDWAQARIADIALTSTGSPKSINMQPLDGTSMEDLAGKLIAHAKSNGVTLIWDGRSTISVSD